MNNDIYNLNNKYGYVLNLNHPKINELYFRFKKWKGISKHIPLSDNERFEFEEYVINNFLKKSVVEYTPREQ